MRIVHINEFGTFEANVFGLHYTMGLVFFKRRDSMS